MLRGTRRGRGLPPFCAAFRQSRAPEDPTRETGPTIYICVTCRRAGEPDEPRPGALLATATSAAAQGSGVAVTRVKCLANCNRGASAAMRANGSWTYIFGGLDRELRGRADHGTRMLADAADGILPWRGRPELLKRGA